MTLVKCKNPSDKFPCGEDFDVMSFILPHVDTIPNCLVSVSFFRKTDLVFVDICFIYFFPFYGENNTIPSKILFAFFIQTEEEYLADNVARVRDIELLTGLKLFSSYNTSTRARLSTFLPVSLWPSLNQKWIDTECGSPTTETCNSQ